MAVGLAGPERLGLFWVSPSWGSLISDVGKLMSRGLAASDSASCNSGSGVEVRKI